MEILVFVCFRMLIIIAMNILMAYLYAMGIYYVSTLIFAALQHTFELLVFSILHSAALHRCQKHPLLTSPAS